MERSFAVLADDERDADLATLAVQLGAVLSSSAGRLDDALARNELALEIAEALRLPEVLSHGLNTKGLILYAHAAGTRKRSCSCAMRSKSRSRTTSSKPRSGRTSTSSHSSTARDRFREALDLSRAGAELARKVGDRGAEIGLENWTAGHPRRPSANGMRRSQGRRCATTRPFQLFYLRGSHLHRGERAEVASPDRGHPGDRRPGTSLQARAGLCAVEAEVVLADEDKLREALAAAEEALADRAELGIRGCLRNSRWQSALEAAFVLGDRGEGRRAAWPSSRSSLPAT